LIKDLHFLPRNFRPYAALKMPILHQNFVQIKNFEDSDLQGDGKWL